MLCEAMQCDGLRFRCDAIVSICGFVMRTYVLCVSWVSCVCVFLSIQIMHLFPCSPITALYPTSPSAERQHHSFGRAPENAETMRVIAPTHNPGTYGANICVRVCEHTHPSLTLRCRPQPLRQLQPPTSSHKMHTRNAALPRTIRPTPPGQKAGEPARTFALLRAQRTHRTWAVRARDTR